MAPNDDANRNIPAPLQEFLPTTFLERGIAVPFTTPILLGTRARPGSRSMMELIVPNPSGGRGVYILPWEDITALCRPTVHDARLTSVIAEVPGATPASIRKAARETAALGLAGRAAAAAARSADVTERQANLTANFELLLALVRHVETAENRVPDPERERPAELERRARRVIARIAPELGRTHEAIANALEEIAVLFSGVGFGAGSSQGRIPRLLGRLLEMRTSLQPFMEAAAGDIAQEADLVAGALDLTIGCSRIVLADIHAAAADVPALLRRWLVEPDPLSELLARPEWLLDGWDAIAALWETCAAHRGQEEALGEICGLIPSVPREIGSWVGHQLNVDAMVHRHHRRVILLEDWRTGRCITDIIQRNETLLEHAA